MRRSYSTLFDIVCLCVVYIFFFVPSTREKVGSVRRFVSSWGTGRQSLTSEPGKLISAQPEHLQEHCASPYLVNTTEHHHLALAPFFSNQGEAQRQRQEGGRKCVIFSLCLCHNYEMNCSAFSNSGKGKFFLEIKTVLVIISHIWISRQSEISNCKELVGPREKITKGHTLLDIKDGTNPYFSIKRPLFVSLLRASELTQ